MTDLMMPILIVAGLIFLPLLLFLGLVALALFIWIWRRIWPYLKIIGKWFASWREVIPAVALVLVVLFALVLARMLVNQGSIPGTIVNVLLIIVVPLSLFFLFLAFAVWVMKAIGWLWPSYKRGFWTSLAWVGRGAEQTQARIPDTRAKPAERVIPPVSRLGKKTDSWLRESWKTVGNIWRGVARYGHRCGQLYGPLSAHLTGLLGRGAAGAKHGLLAVVRFFKRNALLMVLPILLLMGVALMVLALPLLQLVPLVVGPTAATAWLLKRAKALRGRRPPGVGTVTRLPLSGVARVEAALEAVVDFILRLLRLR